jgi:hypothetical protein
MWWRSEFDAAPFPYLLPNARAPKECIKLFLIKLPVSRQFVVPRNMKLLAVPLSQIHDNAQVSLVITIQHKGFYHLFLSSAASADSFFFCRYMAQS